VLTVAQAKKITKKGTGVSAGYGKAGKWGAVVEKVASSVSAKDARSGRWAVVERVPRRVTIELPGETRTGKWISEKGTKRVTVELPAGKWVVKKMSGDTLLVERVRATGERHQPTKPWPPPPPRPSTGRRAKKA
jgi:hypothetical protein